MSAITDARQADPHRSPQRVWRGRPLLILATLLGLFSLALCFAPSAVLDAQTILGFEPEQASVGLGETVTVRIVISNTTALSSLSLRVRFDPGVLSVIDANETLPGTQIAQDELFGSDAPITNTVSNYLGQIDYGISGDASGPFSGSGGIATIDLMGMYDGLSALTFEAVGLEGPGGSPLSATLTVGEVLVGSSALPTASATATSTTTELADETATPPLKATATQSPTHTATRPPSTPASILHLPLVFRERVVIPPTATPTVTPTDTATPTQTITPTSTLSPTPSLTPTITSTPTQTLTPTHTLTPSPTATSTPTLSPGTCIELVVNGDCEGDAGWSFASGSYPAAYSSLESHGGSRALRTGIEVGGPVYGYSTAQQWIEIPSEATELDLTFWTYCLAIGDGDDDRDRHYALIVDEAGGYTTLLDVTWPATNGQTWNETRIDETVLGPYRGQRIALRFETYNNSWGRSAAMYIDDISLQACR